MPKVPTQNYLDQPMTAPRDAARPSDPFLLMAAATMDSMDRLREPTISDAIKAGVENQRQADEFWDNVGPDTKDNPHKTRHQRTPPDNDPLGPPSKPYGRETI